MRAFTFMAFAAAAVAAAPAGAETLAEATTAALETSPALAAERARLEAVRENEPLAWSEALPQITLDATAFDSRSTERTFSTGVRTERNYWVGTIRTSTLLFGSGRIWSSTRQARAEIASAVARYQDAAQNLMLDVTRAYSDVRLAQATLAAQEQAVANLSEQQRFVDANVRNGFLTRTDLAQAEARLAQARADLANANTRLVAANEAYRRLVGRPPTDLTLPNRLTDLPASLDMATEEAARENPAIVAQEATYRARDAAVGRADAQGRLRVFLETNNSQLDVIDDDINRREEAEDTASVRLSMPIFSGGATRARMRQERYERQAASFDVVETRRRVHEAVNVAWSDLNGARARLEASSARLEAAELANRGVRREQEFGQRSVFEVLDQEQELLAARVAYAQAERDLVVAERELAARVGRIAVLSQQAEENTPAYKLEHRPSVTRFLSRGPSANPPPHGQ